MTLTLLKFLDRTLLSVELDQLVCTMSVRKTNMQLKHQLHVFAILCIIVVASLENHISEWPRSLDRHRTSL